MRNDFDLSIPLLADHDGVAQIADTVVNLDFVMQEFLEGGYVEDFVRGWLGGIDDELRSEYISIVRKRKRYKGEM